MNKAKWLGLSLATLFCLTVCDNEISSRKINRSACPIDTFKYAGNYVGIAYSSDNVFLIGVTGDLLRNIFDKNDLTFIVELCMFYEDNSIDTIYINPTKSDFHGFWYSLCAQPHNKLIIGGKHMPVNYMKSEIKLSRKN